MEDDGEIVRDRKIATVKKIISIPLLQSFVAIRRNTPTLTRFTSKRDSDASRRSRGTYFSQHLGARESRRESSCAGKKSRRARKRIPPKNSTLTPGGPAASLSAHPRRPSEGRPLLTYPPPAPAGRRDIQIYLVIRRAVAEYPLRGLRRAARSRSNKSAGSRDKTSTPIQALVRETRTHTHSPVDHFPLRGRSRRSTRTRRERNAAV